MKPLFLLWSCCLLSLCSTISLNAAQRASKDPAKRIEGTYFVALDTIKDCSHVRIYQNSKGEYEGQVIWMKFPKDAKGQYKLDRQNPNPDLRQRRLDQIIILRKLRYNPKTDEWIEGEIYNPLNGKYYRVFAEFMSDGRLKLRGFVGIALLGKTMYWYRIDD